MVTGSGKEFNHSACNSWYLKAWKESLKHPQKPRRAVPVDDDHDGKRAKERIRLIRLAREKYHFKLDGISTAYDTNEKLVYDDDDGVTDQGFGLTIMNVRASIGKYLNIPPLAEKIPNAGATEEAVLPLSLGQSEEMVSKYEGDACISNPKGVIAGPTELAEALKKITPKEDMED